MATHYVDWTGAAGSGDGSSFANRSNLASTLSLSAGDEVRIKKSPDPTSLGTGRVKRTQPGAYYYGRSSSTGPTYSTSVGETYFSQSNSNWQGWETGDVIHIYKMPTSTPSGKNINGIHTVTCTDNWDTIDGKVKIDGFTSNNTDAYSSGTFYWQSATSNSVVLSTADITKSIACRDPDRSAWTASSNVTCVLQQSSGDWNQPVNWIMSVPSDEIQITSSAATGKAAYYELPSTLDLSGYQQISMLICCYSGSDADADHSIRLCTDTAGDTSVHTIPINMNYARVGYWYPLVVDLGTNLNAAIKSIAIYVDTASQAKSYYIQNIVACKASSSADSLTHKSLIGLNTTADPVWYPVGWIQDKIIVLRTWSGVQGMYGYYHGSGAFWSASNDSATIYKREPINVVGTSNSSGWRFDYPPTSGNSSDRLVYSGGWNSTDMSSQDGLTFLRGNGAGRGWRCDSKNYIDTSKIHLTGFYHGYYTNNATHMKMWDVGISDCENYGFHITSQTNVLKLGIDYAFGVRDYPHLRLADSSQASGISTADFYVKWVGPIFKDHNSYHYNSSFKWSNFTAFGTQGQSGMNLFGSNVEVDNLYIDYSVGSYCINIQSGSSLTVNTLLKGKNWSGNGIFVSGGDLFVQEIDMTYDQNDTNNPSNVGRIHGRPLGGPQLLQSSSNTTATILDGTIKGKVSQYGGLVKMKDVVQTWTTDSSWSSSYSGGKILSINYDGVDGAYRNELQAGLLNPETSIRHTASGYAWKFDVTDTSRTMELELGKVVVNASSLVTIGLWVYSTNTSHITGKLIIKKAPEIGIASDVVTDTSGVSATTWTKITATCTPSAAGVLTIKASCDNTSSGSYLYIDDLEVSQA